MEQSHFTYPLATGGFYEPAAEGAEAENKQQEKERHSVCVAVSNIEEFMEMEVSPEARRVHALAQLEKFEDEWAASQP